MLIADLARLDREALIGRLIRERAALARSGQPRLALRLDGAAETARMLSRMAAAR